MKRLSRRVKILLAVSAACLAVTLYLYYGRVVWLSRIRLGVENTGVSVNLAFFHFPGKRYIQTEIQVSHFPYSTRLTNINQLRGQVHITDQDAALRYVRFRTASAFCDSWPWPMEVEIVDLNQMNRMPSFGQNYSLAEFQLSYIKDGGPSIPVDWGLTPEDYRAGKFTSPETASVANSFTVTRWIYSQQLKVPMPKGIGINKFQGWVMKIREFVGNDGSYQRSILIEMEPPKLGRTYWYINRSRA